jgi:uncharacterized protein with von Willebrand factor type A (vWA) domain
MADKSMHVYLNDHLAGAMFGSDLASQIKSQSEGTKPATRAGELATQIEEDQQTLSDLMQRMGITKNPVKQATTWLAEKVSRVKLTGLSSGESELRLFMALETLSLARRARRRYGARSKTSKIDIRRSTRASSTL